MCIVHYILTIVVVKTDVVAGMQNYLSFWHLSIKYIKRGAPSMHPTHEVGSALVSIRLYEIRKSVSC